MIKKYFALSLITASMVVAGCSSDDDPVDPVDPVDPMGPVDPMQPVNPPATVGEGNSVYDTIVASEDHTTLETAINAAGLADLLDNEASPLTVFAPNDAAFAALPEGTVDSLLADIPTLTRILSYHAVSGTVDSTAISEAVTAATEEAPATLDTLVVDNGVAATVTATVGTEGTGLAVNNNNVLTADAGGDLTVGVVHVIGAVLTPPEAPEVVEPDPTNPGGGTPTDGAGAVQAAIESGGAHAGFLAAFGSAYGLQKLDAATDGDPWTVLAPTDAALAGADLVVNDHISTGNKLTPADLLAAGTFTSFTGTAHAVGGTEDALTIGGFAITQVGDGTAASITYSIDGVLP